MNETILRWLEHPAIRRALNESHMGLLTDNTRLLNARETVPNISNVDFVTKHNRMAMRNWGKKTEAVLDAALTNFIAEKLLEYRHIIPSEWVEATKSKHDLDSFATMPGMGFTALKETYRKNHVDWWRQVDRQGRAQMPMMRICAKLGEQWPYRHADAVVADYRKPTADQLLELHGYGKMKLRVVILCLAWAALADDELEELSPLDPYEALKAAGLDQQEAKVMHNKYGKATRSATLQEVADRLNVTRERVRQVESKVVRKLTKIGLDKSVVLWLRENALDAWMKLSSDGGLSVRGFGIGDRGRRRLPAELDLALTITGQEPSDFLNIVGEPIADVWYRRMKPSTPETE